MVGDTSKGGVSEESPDEQNHQAERSNATQTSEGGVADDTDLQRRGVKVTNKPKEENERTSEPDKPNLMSVWATWDLKSILKMEKENKSQVTEKD